MSNTFLRGARALAAAALVTTLCAPAGAALVSYDIVAGTLGGQSYSGSFTFDDASTPGVSFDGFPLYELLSFSFSHDGITYTPAVAVLAASGFGWAALTDGSAAGLELSFGDFSFLPGIGGPVASGGFAASLAFNGPSGFDVIDVTYQLSGPATVPEPVSVALVLIALLGVSAALHIPPSGILRKRSTR